MIVALIDPGSPAAALREVAAGCEEEGVPLEAVETGGERLSLAREAARLAPLSIGLGVDAGGACVVLAAHAGRAYLELAAGEWRSAGRAAARIAARRAL